MCWPGTGTRSPVSVLPTVTSVTWTRSVRWSRVTTSLSTPRRGPRSMPPRPRSPRRSRLTPLAPATWPWPPGRPVHGWCRSRPITSSTGRRPRPTPQITPRHRARLTAGRRRRVSGRCGWPIPIRWSCGQPGYTAITGRASSRRCCASQESARPSRWSTTRGASRPGRDLCEFIVALINTELPGGFYHGTNEGEVTRYDLARAIFALADLDPERVNPCTTTDFPLQAPRPAYSVLDHAAGVPAMPTWHDALQRYLSIP